MMTSIPEVIPKSELDHTFNTASFSKKAAAEQWVEKLRAKNCYEHEMFFSELTKKYVVDWWAWLNVED